MDKAIFLELAHKLDQCPPCWQGFMAEVRERYDGDPYGYQVLWLDFIDKVLAAEYKAVYQEGWHDQNPRVAFMDESDLVLFVLRYDRVD